MKHKNKYIEVKGNEILVKTPSPYTTVRQREHETLQDAKDKEYQLNSACAFLYDCMKLIGISKKKAEQQDFTLNIATGEKIMEAARNKGISTPMYLTISKYDW